MTSAVYFLESPGGSIKIGFSRDVARRILDLSASRATELRLLGVIAGDRKREAELHRLFAADRVEREWFRASPIIRAWVRENCISLEELGQRKSIRAEDPNLSQARTMLMQIVEPVLPGETAMKQMSRALAFLPGRWSWSRVRAIWYSDKRVRLTLQDMKELRDALGKKASVAGLEASSTLDLVRRVSLLEARVARLEMENRTLRNVARLPQDSLLPGVQDDRFRGAVRGLGCADTAEN